MKPRHPARKAAVDRPQAAQIDAIRRLIDQENLPEADTRLRVLRARFTDFKPLYGLAFELAVASGERPLMIVEAWAWTQASPNSVAAWSALADATGADSLALHLAARQRLDALTESTPSPLPTLAPNPLGDLSVEEAIQLELGSALIGVQRFEQAAQVLAPIDHPIARNNLALAHFAQGQIKRARDTWEACWRAVPDNLFALERLVTVQMWLSGRDAARPFENALAHTAARRAEDACAQLTALAVLNRIDDAEAAYHTHAARDWWGRNPTAAWFHHVGAYVAWRHGDKQASFQRLEAADEAVPDFAPSGPAGTALLQTLLTHDTPSWSIGELSAWWPVENLLALSRSGARTEAELVATLGIHPPHPDFLALMVCHGGEQGRALALGILKGLATGGDGAATSTLKDLLRQPCGPDAVRQDINRWLIEQGQLAIGEAAEIYVKGSLRTITQTNIEIHDEPSPDHELGPEDSEEYVRAFHLTSDGRAAEALAAFESLYRSYPDSARLMTAIANIKRTLKHPMNEVEALVRKAWDSNPNYLFGRIGMVCLLADQGDTAAARELLEPITRMERFHYSEWRAYLGAQLTIAKAEGDIATMLTVSDELAAHEARF